MAVISAYSKLYALWVLAIIGLLFTLGGLIGWAYQSDVPSVPALCWALFAAVGALMLIAYIWSERP